MTSYTEDEQLRLLNLANEYGLYEYSVDDIAEYATKHNIKW